MVVSVSDLRLEGNIPFGAMLSLVSAFLYAIYLVFLKRMVQNEDKIDIPMFFGNTGVKLA